MKRATLLVLAVAVLAFLPLAASTFAAGRRSDARIPGRQATEAASTSPSDPTPAVPNRIRIDFSPYIDGQDPNTGAFVPPEQIQARLAMIAPYSTWVRSFGCGHGLELIGPMAHAMGLQVAVNAWLGPENTPAGLQENQAQIACLISQANAGNVDLAIVGSEVLLRGDLGVSALTGYIAQVRQSIPMTIPVTTADVYTTFLNQPTLVQNVDLIFANVYPFWEGYDIQHATAVLNYLYDQLEAAYPQKSVYISETGWPSCGSHGGAIGSPENEALYFNQVESWAHGRNVPMFYFEAFDETWKAAHEGPQGACWGIWDKNGVMKPGMAPIFEGTFVPVPTALPLTCDTDQFSNEFTYIPPLGSFEHLRGRTCGVFDRDRKVILFIYVVGRWWVKPYYANWLTPINRDGTWSVDYTTGGVDEQATSFCAYVVPNGTSWDADLGPYPRTCVTRTGISIAGHVPDPSLFGEPVEVSFALSAAPPAAGSPTGTVTVTGGSSSCTVVLPAGGCSLSSLTPGTHTLVAAYSGDGDFLPATSPAVNHVVNGFSLYLPVLTR